MLDSFKRTIDYLRISVTDRCMLRCTYCMPEEGVKIIRHEDVLSYEEIIATARTAAELGVNKIRLTGGEPLVRRNIVYLIRELAGIQSISDLAMTTNGVLLAEAAAELKEAGLMRINISLDTMDPGSFCEISRRDEHYRVIAGIESALMVGFKKIKINCVIKESPEEADAAGVAEFCREKGLEVRYIRRMDLEQGDFSKVEGGSGGDCARCNRLRLSSDGYIYPCLFSDLRFSVKELGAREAILRAVGQKPERGQEAKHTISRLGG